MGQGKGRIQQALQLAGSQHKYQKIVIFLIALAWIEVNYLLLGPTLIYMDPIFHCQSTGDQRVQEGQACPMINQCKLINKFSVTAQMGLYCDLQWARDTIQSIFSLGSFIGLVVVNMISDAKGRKKAIILSFSVIFAGIICSFTGAFFHQIPLVIMGQFFCGFGSYSMVTICYTLLADFCSDQLRSRAVVIINSVWGFSTFMLGVYYLVELHWQYYLLLIIFLPLLLIAFGFYAFLVESPYILFNQNKQEEALFSLATIAISNGRKQNIPAIRKIIYEEEKKDEQNEASYKNVMKMVKQWKYLKSIILLTVIYGIGNLNFFGISFAFDAEGLGYGYNSLIAGCVEMVSFVYLNFTINSLPRRKGIMGFYGISAILGLCFLIPDVHKSQVITTILLGLGRIVGSNFFVRILAVAYTMIACFQIESFTVEIQSTAAGLIEAFSLYGVLLAPLVVDLSDKIGIDPIAFVAIFLNFAVWPTYFMRQTLKKSQKEHKNPLLQNLKEPTQSQQYRSSQQTMITDSKNNDSELENNVGSNH